MDEQRVTIDMTQTEFRAFVYKIVIDEIEAYIDREMKRLWHGGGDRQPVGLIDIMPIVDE